MQPTRLPLTLHRPHAATAIKFNPPTSTTRCIVSATHTSVAPTLHHPSRRQHLLHSRPSHRRHHWIWPPGATRADLLAPRGRGGSRGHWPPITPPLIALRSAATAKPWTPIGVGRGSCRGPRPPRSPPAHHLPYMGHNGTVESYWSTQTPWKSFYSLSCQLGRIYPTKSDIFIRFQRLDSQHRSDMSDQPDLSGLHRIPETWQPA
jgi:hypothetical protein